MILPSSWLRDSSPPIKDLDVYERQTLILIVPYVRAQSSVTKKSCFLSSLLPCDLRSGRKNNVSSKQAKGRKKEPRGPRNIFYGMAKFKLPLLLSFFRSRSTLMTMIEGGKLCLTMARGCKRQTGFHLGITRIRSKKVAQGSVLITITYALCEYS